MKLKQGTILLSPIEGSLADVKYLVIDLSKQDDVAGCISFMTAQPDGGWSDLYKTTHLVLQFVEHRCSGECVSACGKDYFVGVFPVTQCQWELVMGANPSRDVNPMRPVTNVSYMDICGTRDVCFLDRLSKQIELAVQLPTGDVWWDALCSGGENAPYSGDLETLGLEEESGERIFRHPIVGTHRANVLGFYDVPSTLGEWCADAFCVGEEVSSAMTIRGGCWNPGDWNDGTQGRYGADSAKGNKQIGFRVSIAADDVQTLVQNS